MNRVINNIHSKIWEHFWSATLEKSLQKFLVCNFGKIFAKLCSFRIGFGKKLGISFQNLK
jgi:hypothetical protein